MSFEHTDVGSLAQRLSETLYDQVLGDVSASVSESARTRPTTENQSRQEAKFGDCHIFDYQTFQDGSKTRPGSEKDVERLMHDFDALNFKVYNSYCVGSQCYKYLDLTKELTLHALKIAAAKVPKESKYFVCCFLTHGDQGKLLMNDTYLRIEEILNCFSRSACPNLAEKPKIFIFQACRGDCCEVGVQNAALKKAFCDSADSGSKMHVPDYLDFLLVYSTYEGTKSFKTRDEVNLENNHGSFFIDEFCRCLEQFSGKLDLLQILTIVNYRVAHFYLSRTHEEETNRKKQMPCFTSRLTAKVEFNDITNSPFKSSEDTRYFQQRREMSCLGKHSNKKPLEDKKIYSIQKQRIKLLFLYNKEKNDFGKSLDSYVTELREVVETCQEVNLTRWSKVKKFLEKVADQECKKTDCLICFVACHAKGDHLYDNDGNRFGKRNIVESFSGNACEDLIGKPKIFIFLTFPPLKKSWFPCVSADSADGDDDSLIPVHSDLLEVSITIHEVKQLESVMKKFCNILRNDNSEDFISQLTRMNDELVKDPSMSFFPPTSKNFATFYLTSTLTETLILNNPEGNDF